MNVLNAKTYTNVGENWLVTGYLHYQTNEITIFSQLFGMDNLDNQEDWLNSMKELQLKEKGNVGLSSEIIHFYIPIGKEIEWKNQFAKFGIVEWSELNYMDDVELYTN